MKKKLLALLLAAALLLSLCPLALAEFYAEVYNTESLNIRSGPGSSYSWLGAVPLGERVRVVGESGGWYQVVTLDNKLTGYMSKNFLRVVGGASSAGSAAVGSASYAVVYNTETLNLRSGPGSEYTWLGQANRNDWVGIEGESGNWYQVRLYSGAYQGRTGYMSKNFLKTVSGASSSTATVKNPAGTRFLNLREAPSYTANVLGIFYNGATCQVINRQADGWWYVSVNLNGSPLYGYFRSEYLVMGGSSVGSIGTAYVNTSNGGRLNLRTYPGSDAGVLLQIPNGSAMNVLLKGNYYWMVSYNGEIGFVDISYVTERTPSLPTAAPSTPSTPTTTAGTAIVQTGNSGKLNLREQAYANAGILGRYSNGTAVTVLQKGAAWSYVEVKGQKGYMMSKFLKFTSSAASSRRVYNPNGGTYVNLRSSPNKTSGNVNVRVPVGATVSLLSWGAEWSQVSYGSYTGYMMSWFLK
ncbi:MAG: SH3 domain-containing protein [Christensenellales bacterium]